ncbi:pyridoxine/pyridoxamine 5'-phosphate oxidase [Marisediminicola senii]|uniref:pyridoxine/pyridoxamine 5'-phosphate oxidase n=1 Tax=Marisediminicola senii TaxID=2711233 RepID=UPI0013E9A9EC|nr:pyridoxamine 5'-phosphate oxidase family protein [Marisediminicola senii]
MDAAISAIDPIARARGWLPANDDPARPQMTLATTGVDGFPAARTVLLSAVTPTGFSFNTDRNSHKIADIEADSRVCLVIVWPNFYRQLVVQGEAHRQSDDELAAAYARRSPYLRHLAWLNSAQFARLPLLERRRQWAAAEAEHPEGPLDVSPHWTGYSVTPTRMLFWESATDAASRRTEYSRVDAGWTVDYLPG